MRTSQSNRLPAITVALLLAAVLLSVKLPLVETHAQRAVTIKVGVYLDLSGRTSSFGQSTLNSVRMAAEEVNRAGGIGGSEIQLVVEDDEGEPALAASVVSKLVKEEKVVAVIGDVTSSNTLAAAWLAQQARVPMITPAGTNPKVTKVGDYIFRTCFVDPFQGTVAAKFAVRTLRARRASILTDVNSDYSRSIAETFAKEFTRLGGRIVEKQAYAQTDLDFSGQLTAIRARRPEIIFVPGYYGQAALIAKQARQLGIKVPLLGGDGWDSPQLWQLGARALNGSYMINQFSTDAPSPITQRFVRAYRARYDLTPDAIAALGYDAMMVLVEALKRAGTTEGERLRDAIAETRDFPGVTGNITIDAERNAVKPAIVFKLWGGKFIYHSTIFPDEVPRFLRARAGNAPSL